MLPEFSGLPFAAFFQISQLPSEWLEVQRQWIASQQHADGGFAGRDGTTSLYYSSFGARALALVGCTHRDQWRALGDFLRSHKDDVCSPVDLECATTILTLVRLFVDETVLDDVIHELQKTAQALLASLRRDDGGYAKSPQSAAGSTYATFLTLLSAQMLELSPGPPHELAAFFVSRQRSDGGFAELPFLKDSGTNPTAAAVLALGQLRMLPRIDQEAVISFFRSVCRPDGGFAASPRVPLSDLLSTCSALVALAHLGNGTQVSFEWQSTERYILSLARSHGGFLGHIFDDQPDVEYTFYGILSLALSKHFQQSCRLTG